MYNKIYDPETQKNINIYSIQGKRCIRKFQQLKGGTKLEDGSVLDPMGIFTGKEKIRGLIKTYKDAKKTDEPILLKEFKNKLDLSDDPEYQDLVISDACKTAILLLSSIEHFKVKGKNLSCSTFRDTTIKQKETELTKEKNEQIAIKKFTNQLSKSKVSHLLDGQDTDNIQNTDKDNSTDDQLASLFQT